MKLPTPQCRASMFMLPVAVCATLTSSSEKLSDALIADYDLDPGAFMQEWSHFKVGSEGIVSNTFYPFVKIENSQRVFTIAASNGAIPFPHH